MSKLDSGTGPRSAAIVGAGIAGALAARTLADAGWRVMIVDKSRGVGGRCATRREEGLAFDHGAQYFTARAPRFAARVETWAAAGVIAPWNARFGTFHRGHVEPADVHPRWVAVPGMSALAKHVLGPLPVRTGAKVSSVARSGDTWTLALEDGELVGGFDVVISTLPAPQAASLVEGTSSTLALAARQVELDPCWTVMAAFDAPVALPLDGARVDDGGPLGWVAREASKPGRSATGPDAWVLQASHAWSRAHVEDDPARVAPALLDAFARLTGGAAPIATHVRTHRWRYAKPITPAGVPFLADATGTLVLAGDWLLGAKLEAAAASGIAAAEALLQR
ncbi:FAD-dependent oxidoreductase [Myxococcota bacterium]|nr:FAD-dependent oxidoreductase [Myxococcota bacterium]